MLLQRKIRRNLPLELSILHHLGRLVHHAALVVGGDAEDAHVQGMRQRHVLPVTPVGIALGEVGARGRVGPHELVNETDTENGNDDTERDGPLINTEKIIKQCFHHGQSSDVAVTSRSEARADRPLCSSVA